MSATVPESELQSFLVFARQKIGGGLTETDRKRMVKALLLLLNDSPRANRLAKRVHLGEIDGDTALELIG